MKLYANKDDLCRHLIDQRCYKLIFLFCILFKFLCRFNLLMRSRINNRPPNPQEEAFFRHRFNCKLSHPLHSKKLRKGSRPKRLARSSPTKHQQKNPYMAPRPHLRKYLRRVSLFVITIPSSPLAIVLKYYGA